MIRPILSKIGSRIPGPLRRHPYWTTIVILIVLLVGGGVFALTRPTPPEYITAEAKLGDLTQIVEAVGTVTSDRDLSLEFPSSGIVSEVHVKEGDTVKAGQVLAKLRSGQLSADVASASARVASAQANLDALLSGSRPEDIAIAEAEVSNRKAQLDGAKANLTKTESAIVTAKAQLKVLQKEADTSIEGSLSHAGSSALQHLATAYTSMRKLDDVFNNLVVQYAINTDLPADYDFIRQAQLSVESRINSFKVDTVSYESTLKTLQNARALVFDASEIVRRSYNVISNLPVIGNFTDAVREVQKTTIATEQANTQSALSALDTTIRDLMNIAAANNTKIASQEATITAAEQEMDHTKTDILTYETSLKISESQLALKRAGSRPEDIASARASVQAARADLARAAAVFSDSELRAPIDGTITKVNVKTGESTPTGAAVTMLGVSPFLVEMFVSEVDIPEVRLSQSGSIELDAFPDVHYKLRVAEIDPGATDVDGVSKFRVKLDFVYPHDDLKIGMTGDAEIITGASNDVLSVPRRAVLFRPTGEKYVRILKEDGAIEERDVETGIEGSSGEIEVIGVKAGEMVIELVR